MLTIVEHLAMYVIAMINNGLRPRKEKTMRLSFIKFITAFIAVMMVSGYMVTGALAFDGPWGPAGRAPQDIRSAASALGVSAEESLFLTVLYPAPGDSTAIGYVLGTSASESMGKRLTAATLASGLCIDYDPGATSVTGSRAWEVEFNPKWHRALLNGQGSSNGLKMTAWWTPCNQDGGTPVSGGSQPAPAPSTPPSSGGTYFPETGHSISGRFLTYWQSHGGLAINGYPISDVMTQTLEDGKSYTVQYFERARYELHPENAPPYDVLLGQFGRQILMQDAPSQYNLDCPIDGRFASFYNANGGLMQFGRSLSCVFRQQLENGQTYEVQYFERARFEYHPENAAPNNVQLGQFGRRILNGGSQPTSSPAPSSTPAPSGKCSDITPASAGIGGNWTYKGGNQWGLNGQAMLKGVKGWVVQTPQHPDGNGLPEGATEATSVATAYNLNCKP